jgi:dipeptidyl aminopeptidase/acylaminoacyl peptidase
MQELDSSGYRRPQRRYYVRGADGGSWRLLSETSGDERDTVFVPVAVDAGKNVAFGFSDVDGFTVVSSMALDGSGTTETLTARKDVDVDSLIRIGRQRRVVGASYATEKREVTYFDDELRQLTDRLHAALPGRPLIDIVGASADEQKLLLIAASDTDPGMVYRYDKGTRRLEELLALREPLTGRPMGEMKPITFTAADGTAIPGYLTLPPGSDGKGLPAIVLPHGGPSARDEWGFDWLVQFFVARGYAVLQPNFRGSAGYGSAWFGQTASNRGAPRSATSTTRGAGWWRKASPIPRSWRSWAGRTAATPRCSRRCSTTASTRQSWRSRRSRTSSSCARTRRTTPAPGSFPGLSAQASTSGWAARRRMPKRSPRRC